ncbi:replication initiation and membrane attachment family protein [Fervidibacillus halotolerans]|uniref:DnaD domain protein n=1 Tax=Fervidibacillus halotolerans TaxID=2980027 RepID=A0A9E8LXP7_9BACI|nr:DnaD domain protein [Fervidibacillus halotolerans]WAA11648.1 DnaD domain protein [Fervidibacillus halotolerans]
MNPHWKELIPADEYVVSVDGPFNEGDGKVLTFLYQPLIGPLAISLYFTLKNQVEENRLQSEPYSHYYLMNVLNSNLQTIYETRQKLEAIGLMDSFVKKKESHRSFLYVLKPPLSPKQFFSDGLLNIFLFQKMGRNYYTRLKKWFGDDVISISEYEKVTKDFQQVFASSASSITQSDVPTEQEVMKMSDKPESSPVHVELDHFDFDLFLAGLHESLVPKKAITDEVKDTIMKLAFLYGISPIEMKNIVLASIDEENEIDVEKMRKEARDWYTIMHYQSLPKLVDRTQSPVYQSDINVPKTKEERFIRYLETVSPRQLLEDISNGSEPAASDLQLIENVMLKQKLNPGVANVLIHYCLLRTDMKLSKGFVEKIASHWARKNIKTVKEAMELAKNEHKQYMEWQKDKRQNNRRKPIRSEQLPDWFEHRQQQNVKDEEIENFEEEKKKMEERLKKYKNR